MNHRSLFPLPALLLGLLLAGPAALAASTPSAQARQDLEDRARQEVSELLKTLCPEQCVLLSVVAKVEEETVGEVAPGFDSVSPGARIPVPRQLTVEVLTDSALPAAFRTKLKGLVTQKLRSIGAPIAVNTESVAFPPRNAPHLEAPESRPPPFPAPQQPAVAPGVPGAAQPSPAAAPLAAQDSLSQALPLLAIAALLALTVLVVAALLVLAVRRASAPPELAYGPEPLPLPSAAGPLGHGAGAGLDGSAEAAFGRERLDRLARTLTEGRALRNTLLREALGRGELPLVAAWVRELGDSLLDDLRGDRTVAAVAPALGAELARPSDAQARAAALQELEARVLASRLGQAAGGAEEAFSFLEGVPPEQFLPALRGLSAEAQEVALRFAPSPLRTAALQELGAPVRERLALAWSRKGSVSAAFARSVAQELRQQVSESTGGAEQRRALADLLEGLPFAEQDRLLERLRAEGSAALADSLVVESTLLDAPDDVVASVLLGVAPARAVEYLGGAVPTLRERLLQAAPARLRTQLEEELGLSGAAAPARFLAARRELLARLSDELGRRGLKPSDVSPSSRTERPRLVSDVA